MNNMQHATEKKHNIANDVLLRFHHGELNYFSSDLIRKNEHFIVMK